MKLIHVAKHATLLAAILFASLGYAQAPVPFINLPLQPDVIAPGAAQFTLTINGTGFVSSSTVQWNGGALPTQFVTASQLKATVPAANLATAATANVTVVSPAPGGGTSNTVHFRVAANTGNSAAFTLSSIVPVGPYPWYVTAADFNKDGKADLAVANRDSSDVYILLGDGTGNFTFHQALPVGVNGYPWWIALGDFNNDGNLDFATVNKGAGTVSAFLGDGTGNFSQASSPSTDDWPVSVAVGDFNRDGKLDLAAANQASGTVSILLGDGTGNFAPASSLASSGDPRTVAVGDFNNDGNLDLAVANGNGGTVSIMLGDGNGGFALVSSPSPNIETQGLAVGDFNGDGNLDLVVGCERAWTFSILVGDGTGNFTLASSLQSGGSDPTAVVLEDFNGDNSLDFAIVNDFCCSLSIFLGDGTANFSLNSTLATGNWPQSVTAGDFNADGKLDLAVANATDGTVWVLLGSGDPVVLSRTSLTFGIQLLGTSSASQPVTLMNNGSSKLQITSIAGSANFTQTNDCGASLDVGRTCTINVTFRPRGTGTLTGKITITDNSSTSPQTILLSGVGTAVTLEPSRLDFGQVILGKTSNPQTATVTNYGKKALKISGIHIIGTDASLFSQTNNCGTSVAAGRTCTITMRFKPRSVGNKTATLNVADDGGASPQTVTLTGYGQTR